MKKLGIFLCCALLSASAGVAGSAQRALAAVVQQDVFTHKEAGVQFQLPKGWKAEPDGEIITASSADDALQVVFWVPDADSFDTAVKELDKELDKTIKNVKMDGKPTQDTHNGMTHFGEYGTGEVNGATIAWSVDGLAAKKPLLILTFGAPQLMEKHALEYQQLVKSIKKIN